MSKKKFYSTLDVIREASPALEADKNSHSTMAMRVYATIMENICADIEDVCKSRVTIRVLLEREFLKELRRYKFWTIQMIRAVALGCLLGE